MSAFALLYDDDQVMGHGEVVALDIAVHMLSSDEAKRLQANPEFAVYQAEVSVTSSSDESLQRALKQGVIQAYTLMRWRQMAHDSHGVFVWFTFETERPVREASAGLLGALAFVDAYLSRCRSRTIPFDYAATGQVHRVTGELEEVEYLPEKLLTALAQLAAGSRLFYPAIQDTQIEPVLKTTAKARDIHLCPVRTVEEAVLVMLEAMGVPQRAAWHQRLAPHLRRVKLGLGVVAVLTLWWMYSNSYQLSMTGVEPASPSPDGRLRNVPGPTLHHIRGALTQGDFSVARQQMDWLVQQYPEHAEVGYLKTAITQDVQAQIEMTFLGGPEGYYEPDVQSLMYTLKGSEDGFRVTIWPLENIYVYLYVRDDVGAVRSLWPIWEETDAEHQPLIASPEKAYHFPAQNVSSRWFPVEHDGRRIRDVAILTSRWPARDLERLERELGGTGGRQASQQLWARIRQRQNAQIGGVDVRLVQLVHTVSAP